LSAASFEAARSEQLRLPAEGPLKRRDGSSRKGTLNALPEMEFSPHATTLFALQPPKRVFLYGATKCFPNSYSQNQEYSKFKFRQLGNKTLFIIPILFF
jgi:hypothetical protein